MKQIRPKERRIYLCESYQDPALHQLLYSRIYSNPWCIQLHSFWRCWRIHIRLCLIDRVYSANEKAHPAVWAMDHRKWSQYAEPLLQKLIRKPLVQCSLEYAITPTHNSHILAENNGIYSHHTITPNLYYCMNHKYFNMKALYAFQNMEFFLDLYHKSQ